MNDINKQREFTKHNNQMRRYNKRAFVIMVVALALLPFLVYFFSENGILACYAIELLLLIYVVLNKITITENIRHGCGQ